MKIVPNDKKVIESVFNILKNNQLLNLSTTNKDQPYSSTAYYVFDKNFSLYIWTGINTLHSKNIKKNNKISVNIFNSSQKWGSLLLGMQALGNAYPVNNKELIKAGLMYFRRYPKVIRFVKKPRDFHNQLFESVIYKIQLNKIKLFDEKTFGKDEYRELIIKR